MRRGKRKLMAMYRRAHDRRFLDYVGAVLFGGIFGRLEYEKAAK